jgi:hypothetical protein
MTSDSYRTAYSLVAFAILAFLAAGSSDSSTSSSSSHDQREADTQRGFSFGREIGARRAREGFPKPSVDYLNSIIQTTTPNESDGYKLGFKAGYIDGWEKTR